MSDRSAPEYRSWIAMRTRCNNPRRKSYANYGGRGITVCARWDSFGNFLEDMGPRPPGTTLDRIDSDGNYEPSNCRWATAVEQGRNTRRVIKAKIDGEAVTISEIAERTGLNYDTVYYRVLRRGGSLVGSVNLETLVLSRERRSPQGVWAKDGDDSRYIGTKWGSLTIIRRTGVNIRGRVFLCSCDCGGEKETNLGFLVGGDTVSCGCTTRQKASEHARSLNARRKAI